MHAPRIFESSRAPITLEGKSVVHRRSVLTALTGFSAEAAVAAFSRRSRAQGGAEAPRETLAVLGTGHFGSAMGKRLGALGYPIVYGSRTPDAPRVQALIKESGTKASAASHRDAASRGAIVIFAIPWEPVQALLPELGDLTGKLVIDPMIAKPTIVEHYPFAAAPSTAEQLQSWTPGAKVVKAFCTISYVTLAHPRRAGGPLSIPFAGNDRNAKQRVAQLITDLGLAPIDTGSLVAARHIENVLWFEVACNLTNQKPFELYMRLMAT